tara:strand:- start:3867 stop:4739 length:873 start_codon:yes stop_codon:yes gene_type:complete
MKKIIILIPVFNDWESLKRLIKEINETIKDEKNFLFECLIINDASTQDPPKLIKPKFINSLKLLNMRENKGHARCNAFGIRYINQNENFDYLILMDGDGEDRPIEIKNLVNKIKNKPEISVVAKRIKRSEGIFFRFLYYMHKLITFMFTGEKINFGNYSCLNKNDTQIISSKASLWSSYSGTVKRYIKNLDTINSTRGIRYFGPSKMSLYKLFIHSLSIIAVFKLQVFLRSIFIIVILIYVGNYIGPISILFQFLLIIFCVAVFFASLRENQKKLIESQENLINVKNIPH